MVVPFKVKILTTVAVLAVYLVLLIQFLPEPLSFYTWIGSMLLFTVYYVLIGRKQILQEEENPEVVYEED